MNSIANQLPVSKEYEKCALFLFLLAYYECPTKKELCEPLHISNTSFHRMLNSLKAFFLVDVAFVPVYAGQRGRSGYYAVKSWGVIDPAQFKQNKQRYSALLQTYGEKSAS